LPPHVAHTGRSSTADGFTKRVLYLDHDVLPPALTGPAASAPTLADRLLRHRVGQLHAALAEPGEALEAESRLALVRSRLQAHLHPSGLAAAPAPRRAAEDLRDLLDSRVAAGLTLREAAGLLHAHPDHLVRVFTATFGLPPHRYLIGRRVDAARRLLLAGVAPGDTAVEVGFHDQAHLNRHFTRQLGVTPARFARERHGPRRR
jgi:AraC-like DNA-binding protein